MDNKPMIKSAGKLGQTYGQSGTVIQRGIITTDEYNLNLVGKVAIRNFEIMRRSDPTVRATLQLCKLPLLGLPWDIQPASDEESDIKIAEFIKKQTIESHKVNWHAFLTEGLTCLDFGYSVCEKTLELTDDDGSPRIGIASLGYRKQNSILAWETQDQKPGITQQLISSRVDIPQAKLIIFTHMKEGDNVEGISLLRFIYKDWYMKDSLIKVNGISLERLGSGIPVIQFGDSTSEIDKASARTILRQLRANEESYLEVPVDGSIEMLDMKGSSVRDILPTINYHDRQMLLSILGQFLSLGASDASGSRAVSSDHSKLFMLSEEALARMLQATIQDQLINQLCDLNFTDLPNGYPMLTHGKLEDDDITGLSTAVNSLMSAKALTPNFETEQTLRKTLHLPELTEEDRKAYDEQQKLALETQKKALEAPKVVVAPAGNKPKPTKATALDEARRAERQLIDIVTRG